MRAAKALAGLGLILLLSGCESFADSDSADARPVDRCIQADHRSDYRDLKELLESDNHYSTAPCGSGIDAQYRFDIERYSKKDGEFKVEVTYPLHNGKPKPFEIPGRMHKGESADETAHRLIKGQWKKLQAVIGREKL